MSTPLDILNQIKSSLQGIVKGNTVTIQGASYTFQNNIGTKGVSIGISLQDTEVDVYPAAAVNSIFGAAGDLRAVPDISVTMAFAVEMADKLNGRDWYTVCHGMRSDILAAVDLKPTITGFKTLVPSAPGRPVFEFLAHKTGSNIAVVRCWYHCSYAESYPDSRY